MKKNQYAWLYIVLLCMTTIVSLYIPQTDDAKASDEAVVIPDEAIRLRILANSDREEDQVIKREIRDEVNAHITEWVGELTSLEEARQVLRSKLPEIQEIAVRIVQESGLEQEVEVDFGTASFPTKLYGQFLYPAGEYEAIVISIGEASGANWWCVLFPPLCFLDFSNGTAVSVSPMEDDMDQVPQAVDEETEEVRESEVTLETEDTKEIEIAAAISSEQEPSEAPLYVEQDEQSQTIETRWFIVDFFKGLF